MNTATSGPSAEGVFSFTKAQIRGAVLDIVFGRTTHHPQQIGLLFAAVALHLMPADKQAQFPHPRLDSASKMLLREVVWDLIAEKVLTPGLNVENHDLPYFRLHSEAQQNLKK